MSGVTTRKGSAEVQLRILKRIEKGFYEFCEKTHWTSIDEFPDEISKAQEFVTILVETVDWLEERITKANNITPSPKVRKFEKQLVETLRQLDHFVCRFELLNNSRREILWGFEELTDSSDKHLCAVMALKEKWKVLERNIVLEQ